MRDALRGLTTRGRCFLAAAAAAAGSALALGEQDLLRVSALLAALPLLAAGYVGLGRHRLTGSRGLEPRRLPVGATASIRLRLQNLSTLATGTLLLEDRLPYPLGTRPRLALERLGGRRTSTVSYTAQASVRGRYEIGPLLVRLTDPFGMCELVRAFPGVDHLTVTPELVPLPAVRLAGERTGAGDSPARSVAVHGEDDIATREYRHGDDLRRVHWRSTARAGELMVRREEQPWDSQATVVLDTRARAHQGDGPTASFEWAVSAAASVAIHLRRTGYQVRLVSPAFDVTSTDQSGDGLLLDHLAEVRTRGHAELTALVQRVRTRGAGGLVIGVFGPLTSGEAELLAGLRGSGITCVGLLMDTSTWLALPDEERARAHEEHQTAAGRLLAGGWRVIGVRRGDRLAALWPQAARGAQGFALRAASAETVSGGRR